MVTKHSNNSSETVDELFECVLPFCEVGHFHGQKQLPKVFYKKIVQKTSPNSQENTITRASLLISLVALGCRSTTLLSKKFCRRGFHRNFAKFLKIKKIYRTSIEHPRITAPVMVYFLLTCNKFWIACIYKILLFALSCIEKILLCYYHFSGRHLSIGLPKVVALDNFVRGKLC